MFTTDEFKTVRSAIIDTWSYIASDAYEMCEDDNEIAIEMCLDADRLTTCTENKAQSEQAQAILTRLYAEKGVRKVWKELNNRIQLL